MGGAAGMGTNPGLGRAANPALRPQFQYKSKGHSLRQRSLPLPAPRLVLYTIPLFPVSPQPVSLFRSSGKLLVFAVQVKKASRRGGELMASNYVDTAAEEGRFHGHGHGHGHSTNTTPTGSAASPKNMRKSWSSASSAHGHGAAPKCVCAPPTHAGSFKCRLHRTSSHGHPTSPPSAATPSSSSRTVAA